MKTIIILFIFACTGLLSQNITNTLGSSGIFTIKDGSTSYLTLSQSTGQVNILKTLRLENTTNSTTGVIFKGIDRFIHNFGFTNTFMGINSGNFTMTGVENTAVGYNSLVNNSSGYNNTAVGCLSLLSNSTGYLNTALGYQALNSNTTGDQNTAVGFASMNKNTTGRLNTAIGNLSLNFNTTGVENTAIGQGSLSNSNGSLNTAVGYSSGTDLTTGNNNTLIGNNAEPTTGTVSNQITLGNSSVTSLRCNVTTITALSDARDKKNITDLSLGLDFITKLKPRQFNWDKREWYDNNISDGSKVQESPTAGFIAQELDEAQTTANTEWLNLVLKDNPEKWEATPGNLLPIMVKAIQELNSKCEDLETENDELKDKLAKFEQMQNMLALEIEKLRPKETGNSTDLTEHSK